jgi:hypothetical protein
MDVTLLRPASENQRISCDDELDPFVYKQCQGLAYTLASLLWNQVCKCSIRKYYHRVSVAATSQSGVRPFCSVNPQRDSLLKEEAQRAVTNNQHEPKSGSARRLRCKQACNKSPGRIPHSSRGEVGAAEQQRSKSE